jgi:hypothetical protein
LACETSIHVSLDKKTQSWVRDHFVSFSLMDPSEIPHGHLDAQPPLVFWFCTNGIFWCLMIEDVGKPDRLLLVFLNANYTVSVWLHHARFYFIQASFVHMNMQSFPLLFTVRALCVSVVCCLYFTRVFGLNGMLQLFISFSHLMFWICCFNYCANHWSLLCSSWLRQRRMAVKDRTITVSFAILLSAVILHFAMTWMDFHFVFECWCDKRLNYVLNLLSAFVYLVHVRSCSSLSLNDNKKDLKNLWCSPLIGFTTMQDGKGCC